MEQAVTEQDQSAIVVIDRLSFQREGRYILNDVSLTVQRGTIVGIMGPSGIGKTTLLSLINALETPDSGRIYFQGVDMHQLDDRAVYATRKKIGHMFQNGALFGHLSVFENVAFPLRENTDLSEDMIRDLVMLKLEAVGLRGVRHKMPDQLSGGMARRVALARATALDPDLMLYDEPFTGQDPISTGVLTQSICKMRDILGLTSIVVSHDMQAITQIADIIYLIGDAKVLASGSAADILASKSPAVQQFVSGSADGVMPFHHPARNTLTQDLLYVR